jgi:zinc/manganese transport system substrate-binding protein
MRTRRSTLAIALAGLLSSLLRSLLGSTPALAQDPVSGKLKVVATFSILADLAANVGGAGVVVTSLVGANGDVHVYAPTPADARAIAEARLVVVNGLGLEGWIERLVKASGTKAPVIVASGGVKARPADGDPRGDALDPHAWQSIANTKIYVGNIRDALVRLDPAGRSTYEANASAYLSKLDALERDVRDTIAKIPAERRKIITTHGAFGYFGATYGVAFIAPQGVSTEAEPSAKDAAQIISQIKAQKIPALFLENVTDPRLLERIAKETGAKIGGTLYSDALTDAAGAAPTYIDMVRHNVRELASALAG